MAGAEATQAERLIDLLAAVSSSTDEDTAIVAACTYAGQALAATCCALATGNHLRRWIGPVDGQPFMATAMATVAPGRRHLLEVGGFGPTALMAARLDDGDRMVAARPGTQPFTVEELNLLRGMTQVLGLSRKMLRTLEAERRRRRLVRHLYSVQQAISQRAPLQLILEHIVRGAQLVLGTPRDPAALWLLDLDNPAQSHLAASLGFDLNRHNRSHRFPIDATGAPGESIRTGSLVVASMTEANVPPLASQCGAPAVHTIATPVRMDGRVHGSLMVSRCADRPFTTADHENVLLLAEHVSLAIADAKLVHDIDQARHDALTGLASRALFLTRLAQQLAKAPGGDTAALFIDLDQFKAVNDTLGHNAGDELLAAVAQRITAIVRRGDLAARFGGDEFAIMLPDVPQEEQVRDIALRIVEELSQPIAVAAGMARVSASVGIARSNGLPVEAKELVRRADVAMYEAKRAGRHRVSIYTPEMDGASPTDSHSTPTGTNGTPADAQSAGRPLADPATLAPC